MSTSTAWFLFFLSLLVPFYWDYRQAERALGPRPEGESYWHRSRKLTPLRWRTWAAMSFIFASMAVAEFRAPSLPPFTGKMSDVYQFAFSTFGRFGPAYVWTALWLYLLRLAFVGWRSSKTRATELPHRSL